MKKVASLVLALLVILPSIATAQNAESGSFSDEGLARLSTWLESYVARDQIAGAVLVIHQHGQAVYERVVGWSDRESRRPMTTRTLFRIASQTKAITTTAFLTLFEEGKVGLDDPVSRYIPSFARTTVAVPGVTGTQIVPAKREVTIRDLLTHSAGISYGVEDQIAALYQAKGLGPAAGFGWYLADKEVPVCATMETLASLPFVAQPGEAWVYGYATDVLGCVIERISGMPLDQFIAARVTGPLEMRDTRFFVPPSERERIATVYASGADGRVVRAPDGARGQGHYLDGPRMSYSGGGGLVSTASDYLRFLEMLRNGGTLGSVRILSPATVRLMMTNQLPGIFPRPGRGFGFGFQIIERFGSNGLVPEGVISWGGAYSSDYFVDRSSGIVALLLTQTLPNTTDIRPKFPSMVYQAVIEP